MTGQQEKSFSGEVTQRVALNYLLHLPPEYETNEHWPLIIYLHDYDARGSDLSLLLHNGLSGRIATGADYPAIVVSPQCPDDCFWPEQTTELKALLDHLLLHYKVNARRVYLTGLNLGGFGVWALAARFPQCFAAIAPVGGGGEWWMLERLKTVPTWAFHLDGDDVVPLIETKVLVRRIRTAGGNARMTVYADFQHELWNKVYDNPELFSWLLEQQR
jgi:predicted peptidase